MKDTIKITAPIYYKDYMPRARKNPLLGLNWYTQAANTFSKAGKTTTGIAAVKATIHQKILDNKEEILSECPNWNTNHLNGFKVHYNVYAKTTSIDGHNVRSAMEKMMLDALQEAGIIDDDKYVYQTSSNFYLDPENPRIELILSHIDYQYEHDYKAKELSTEIERLKSENMKVKDICKELNISNHRYSQLK